MTNQEARSLYLRAIDDTAEFSYMEWKDIRSEMKAVIAAPTDRKAANVILWWGCWPVENGDRTATATARKIRAAWAKMKRTR